MSMQSVSPPDLSAAPPWFQTAVAAPITSAMVDVTGNQLHYLAWNAQEVHKPSLVLVHGFRGHARWWSAIAPFFTEQFRVYALDLSGMGDSGVRAHYDPQSFAQDVIDFVTVLQLAPVTLIGHSFGGSRCVRACVEAPELFSHAIIVDSRFAFPDDVPRAPPRWGRNEVHADYAQLRTRYRLVPDQSVAFPEALDYLSYHSIRQVEQGWRWKFDPHLPAGAHEPNGLELLAAVRTRSDYMMGECSSVVSLARGQRIAAALHSRGSGGRGPIIVPQAQHHLMMDQPLAFIAALRALLA